ncbi:MAG: hypothetical protein ACXW2U_00850 [Telluria sp.]
MADLLLSAMGAFAEFERASMTLSYDGQPQVAALVQNVSPAKPEFRPFYDHSVSPDIVGTCP